MALSLDTLNSMQIDVLREIGNIGAGNAATALAKMLAKKIDMDVPKVNILEFRNVGDLLGGEERVVAGIYFKLDGDIDGSIMFILDYESAKKLINLLFGQEIVGETIDEMGQSALQEVGNILAGSYCSSLSSLTGLKLNISVPSLSVDMAGAILSVPVILFGQVGDKVMLIETDFSEGGDKVNGHFFLIPDEGSFEPLLQSLGVL